MTGFEIRNCDAVIGAEVLGFDPKVVPGEDDRRRLRQAFDERSVLVFRDVEIDFDTQQYLSDLVVGRSILPEDSAVEDDRKMFSHVSNRIEGSLIPYGRILWHTDTMWSDRPEDAISLYGVEIEDGVAATYYASTAQAWETLPDALRARVEALEAFHGEGQQQRAKDDPTLFLYEHPFSRSVRTPVALRHPRTGRTLLYVSEQQTRHLVGLPEDDSTELLDALLAHLYRPEHQYVHQWRVRDFVVWDNLAAQHTRDYVALDGPARTLRKCAVPPPWIRPDLPALPTMVAVEK
jgi:taurine dioxygenase